jgi:CPA2 family monovalent cation:H+ antiporter-2
MFILAVVMVIKGLIVYLIIKRQSNSSDALKSSIALCQIGEFSFPIFALASSQQVISAELTNILILITVLSMIVTLFMINNIYKLASLFVVEYFESDKIPPVQAKNHTIVCGFTILGRIVAKELTSQNSQFLIISDNLQHVLLARKRGYTAYFGHLDRCLY